MLASPTITHGTRTLGGYYPFAIEQNFLAIKGCLSPRAFGFECHLRPTLIVDGSLFIIVFTPLKIDFICPTTDSRFFDTWN